LRDVDPAPPPSPPPLPPRSVFNFSRASPDSTPKNFSLKKKKNQNKTKTNNKNFKAQRVHHPKLPKLNCKTLERIEIGKLQRTFWQNFDFVCNIILDPCFVFGNLLRYEGLD
jgi:hypothetical protein